MGVCTWRARAGVLVAVAVCIVVAYWPFLFLPFISDDYVQIQLGRDYGPSSQWGALLRDALYRCRATSILLTHWTEAFFALQPLAYAITSLAVHLGNAMLVLALGAWRIIGFRVSILAALLFGVYEAHQEAVVWYAALPELLVFAFSVSSLLCFIRAVQKPRGTLWSGASVALFVAALFSKESAVAVLPLTGLVLWTQGALRKRWTMLVPYAVLAVIYTGLIFAAARGHLHFNDAGTFSLSAPFPTVLARSAIRALWIWGALAVVVALIWRRRRTKFQATVAIAWIVCTLLPYSFLTYMPRVPSRHMYFASAGVSILLASALLSRSWSARGRTVAAVAVIGFVSQNVLYLRTRKLRQYQERAAITEALLDRARNAAPPLDVSCFPYSPTVAELAIEIGLGRQAVMTIEKGARNGLNLCSGAHFSEAGASRTIHLNW